METIQNLIGKKATICKYGDFGFLHSILCTIEKVYRKDYAQYSNLIHIEYRPKGKRSSYVTRIYPHSSILIYAGHVTLDTEMFRTSSTSSSGMTVKESLSCFSDEYISIARKSTTETPVFEYVKETQSARS